MERARSTAVVVAIAIIGMASMRVASATHQSGEMAFSAGGTSKGLVVKTGGSSSVTDLFPTMHTLDSRMFAIPAGESQLFVVDFDARMFCSGSGGCTARASIGRTLGTATEAEPGSVIIQSSGEGSSTHGMSWALCLRNATTSSVDVGVWMEVARFNASTDSFSVGPYTLKIARNSPCSPTVNV